MDLHEVHKYNKVDEITPFNKLITPEPSLQEKSG